MSQQHKCPCTTQCLLQKALESIGGKWKLPVLCSLTVNGKSRYNEILHSVQGISNTMLSQTLRELERDHLILRREYLEVPVRVEYEVSEKAKKLQPILLDLIQWTSQDEPEKGAEEGSKEGSEEGSKKGSKKESEEGSKNPSH